MSARLCVASASLVLMATLAGCAGMSETPANPVTLVPRVDLPRFMGDWYVIANIPTFLEKGAHNAVDTYRLDADGSIATTFTYNAGRDDGPVKAWHPRGFVVPGTGDAVWGMRFVWPIRAEYRIFYVDEAYSRTIIARSARDYLWIMARTPQIPEEELRRLIALAGEAGYDTGRIQRVPQRAVAAATAGGAP